MLQQAIVAAVILPCNHFTVCWYLCWPRSFYWVGDIVAVRKHYISDYKLQERLFCVCIVQKKVKKNCSFISLNSITCMNSDSLEAVIVRYQQKRTPSSISVSSHIKCLWVLSKAPGLYRSYQLLLILLLLLLRRGAMWMQSQMVNWLGYKSTCLCLMPQHKHVSGPHISTHAQKTFCYKQFADTLTWMLVIHKLT